MHSNQCRGTKSVCSIPLPSSTGSNLLKSTPYSARYPQSSHCSPGQDLGCHIGPPQPPPRLPYSNFPYVFNLRTCLEGHQIIKCHNELNCQDLQSWYSRGLGSNLPRGQTPGLESGPPYPSWGIVQTYSQGHKSLENTVQSLNLTFTGCRSVHRPLILPNPHTFTHTLHHSTPQHTCTKTLP